MSQEKWDDLYNRLTSRKFWAMVVAAVLAIIGYYSGQQTFQEMQNAILIAVATWMTAEMVVDAVGNYNPRPAQPDTVTNVVQNAPPETTVEALPDPVTVSRSRPKR